MFNESSSRKFLQLSVTAYICIHYTCTVSESPELYNTVRKTIIYIVRTFRLKYTAKAHPARFPTAVTFKNTQTQSPPRPRIKEILRFRIAL